MSIALYYTGSCYFALNLMPTKFIISKLALKYPIFQTLTTVNSVEATWTIQDCVCNYLSED